MSGAATRECEICGAHVRASQSTAPTGSPSFAFGRRAVQLTGFSTSSAEAEGVLGSLAVAGRSGTALYDAVVQAAQSLRASPLAAG